MIAGKTPLAKLFDFVARRWYTVEINRLAHEMATQYNLRNEIIINGHDVVPGANFDDEILDITTVLPIEARLKGRMVRVAALTNHDLMLAGNKPIFQDGSDASGIVIASDEVANVTVIISNSDGAGGANEDDNDTPTLIAIVAGTATTYDGHKHLTSVEVQAALAASTNVHDGTTGWVHWTQTEWSNPLGVPAEDITLNRNNVLGV